MDTLPNEVLVHHLLPAVLWVNHSSECLDVFPGKKIPEFMRNVTLYLRMATFEKYGVCNECNVKWFTALRLVSRRFRDAIQVTVHGRLLFGQCVAQRSDWLDPIPDPLRSEPDLDCTSTLVRNRMKAISIPQFWSEVWQYAQTKTYKFDVINFMYHYHSLKNIQS